MFKIDPRPLARSKRAEGKNTPQVIDYECARLRKIIDDRTVQT